MLSTRIGMFLSLLLAIIWATIGETRMLLAEADRILPNTVIPSIGLNERRSYKIVGIYSTGFLHVETQYMWRSKVKLRIRSPSSTTPIFRCAEIGHKFSIGFKQDTTGWSWNKKLIALSIDGVECVWFLPSTKIYRASKDKSE